jgi:hypothetical protein
VADNGTDTGSAEDLEDAAAVFTGIRPRLFGIAYRMLSSASEAEDLVQEVRIRWQATDRGAVVNPGAFLATTATRLAINALKSARACRETYIGPWLPEPVDTEADPYLGAERGEALEFAALLLMEKQTFGSWRRTPALAGVRLLRGVYQGSGPSALWKPPVGPSASSTAHRTMHSAACAGVRTPVLPLISVST